jgi:VanZ family protein
VQQKPISYFFARKRLNLFLFLLNLVGVAFATLWPFVFSPSNDATWIPNQNGIHFSRHGLLLSSAPLVVPTSANDSFTIELWLRSDENWSLRNVFGVYSLGGSGGLHIFQWDGGLLVSRGFPRDVRATNASQIYTANIFRRGKLVFLAIASSPSGTAIYVNGEQRQFFPRFQIHANDLSGQLIVGTAPTDFSPWRGDFYILSVSSSTLTPEEVRSRYGALSRADSALASNSNSLLTQYSFSESSGSIIHNSVAHAPDLQIPERFSVPYKPILQSPLANYVNTRHYYRDVLANILGFMPYGFLLFACLVNTRFSRFAVLYTFLSGAAFSFFIELIQGYIPQRDSGFNDVITNGLGALFGALLAALLARRIRRD